MNNEFNELFTSGNDLQKGFPQQKNFIRLFKVAKLISYYTGGSE